MCYSGDILHTTRKGTHLDNDSCLPIYKKYHGDVRYSATNPVRTELHFPHFVRVMVITVLWAELWFVVGVELCFFSKRVAWEE